MTTNMTTIKITKKIKRSYSALLILLLTFSSISFASQDRLNPQGNDFSSSSKFRYKYVCIKIYKTTVHGTEFINEDESHPVSLTVYTDSLISFKSDAMTEAKFVNVVFPLEYWNGYGIYDDHNDFFLAVRSNMIKEGVQNSTIHFDNGGNVLNCKRIN